MEETHKNFLTLLLILLLSSQLPTTLSHHHHHHGGTIKHFVLVHGACHGAWSWYKLSALLQSSGHTVTSLDMAASGVDPRRPESLRSFSEYVEPLMGFMKKLPASEKVILVGHSQGGLAISKAMEGFPDKIYVAVFVSAAMPGPSLNASFLLREDLTLAKTLMRPVRLFGANEWNKELHLSTERYGSVKRVFVVSENDLTIKMSFQRWVIRRNPPNDVLRIRGSDHMVMMSKPLELFNNLLSIAQKYSSN